MPAPLISPGKRALISGSTGCGKSTLACWLMKRSPGRWVVLNPKHTAAYAEMDNSCVVNSLDISKVEKSMMKYRYTIVNPDSRQADSDNMDDFIMDLHSGWRNVGLVCDELYTVHKGAVAGKGLIGWLTRGRELKQSFIGLTQRPAWISKFCFSESDYLGFMYLFLPEDRKRAVEMTDIKALNRKLPEREWVWFDPARENVTHYGPVSLD